MLVNLAQVLWDENNESFIEELVNIAKGKVKFGWQGVNRTLAGEQIDVSLTWSAAPGHEDDLSKVIISLQDITEQKRAEEALRNISLVDDLTGLYNRRGLHNPGRAAVEACQPDGQEYVVIVQRPGPFEAD